MSDSASPARPRASWVSFEGIEGSGKSTQIARLAQRLNAAGREALTTREPGGTPLGRKLRELLLQPDSPAPTALVELLLYTADRAQHLSEVVLPALERGIVVLCDRYVDATFAYQGDGRGLGRERVRELHRSPPLDARPERTILLDLEVAEALSRARALQDREAKLPVAGPSARARPGTRSSWRAGAGSEGRFEEEPLAFHATVRAAYLDLAAEEPQRFRVVDASGSADEVERRVVQAVVDLWPELEMRP